MNADRLILMANQIATFFSSQPGTDQAARVAVHLNDFWEPRMRAALLAHVRAGGVGLSPLVVDAIPMIREPA